MRGAHTAFAAVVALVASAALAVPATAQEPVTSISLSLRSEHVVFGDKARITARLTGHPAGNAGQQLVLLATPWPFGGESVAQTLTTGSTGAAVFRPAPRVNTRYRVALAQAPDVASRSRTVFATPAVSADIADRPGNRVLFEVFVRFPRERSMVGVRSHFYDRVIGESRWVRRATRRFHRTADERAVASYSFRRRSAGRTYRMWACGNFPAGTGRPDTMPRGCGRRTISDRAVRRWR